MRRLVKLKKNEKTLTMAAAKAGMSRKTARKYLKLPSQCQPERYWRTRSDPFESVCGGEILFRSPTVKRSKLSSAGRGLPARPVETLQRPGSSSGRHVPAEVSAGAQSDFTMGRLGVTIQGQPFPHLDSN